MSEADRVFSGRRGPGKEIPFGEKRLIHTASRRGGVGGSRSRVVEVVHVRRGGSGPTDRQPRPVSSSVRAETWPEGFHAKPAQPVPPQDLQLPEPEPASPAVHVMPMWEPSPPQPAPTVTQPDEVPAAATMDRRRQLPSPKSKAAKRTTRSFADPFAAGDDGANCLRCGYLVEPVRERRGLLTCSMCG